MKKKYETMIKWTGNYIGDSKAIKIIESLMMDTTLTELNLGSVIENKRMNVIERRNRRRNMK